MKSYGIKITLPEDDPLRAEHLLGPDWAGYRWYATAEERDDAFTDMQEELLWYRKGDRPSQIVEKVEKA